MVRQSLVAGLDASLVDELLAAYEEAKRNFYLGGHRLGAVEGGRFCEAAFRLLEQIATGCFTALGKALDTESLVRQMGNLPAGSRSDAIRLYIPRALRVVYDIRNNRNAAHLADGIDPNLQDSMLVVSILDWVLAEFVRLYHGVTPDEAQSLIETIVTRTVPVVEDFDGFLKVLNPNLKANEYCLVLLYQKGNSGATLEELRGWAKPKMRANIARTLRRLEHELAFIHHRNGTFIITAAGKAHVERRRLLEF